MSDARAVQAPFTQSWRRQLREHRAVAFGLAVALLAVFWLLLGGGAESFSDENRGFLGGAAGFGATALGALLALGLRSVETRAQDCMLGFAAGMMLAASSFSRILPGLEAARGLLGSGTGAALTVTIGLGLGVLLMLGLDYFTPHQHESSGVHGPAAARIGGVWLFVLAIVLHNLPEGMAIGVGFAHGDLTV